MPRPKLRPHREPHRADRAEAKLEAKMNDPDAVDFRDFPLRDALEYLDTLQGLKLQYDTAAIRGTGVTMDQPITLNLKDFPLRATFKLLLEPVQMAWIIRDGAVVVTTRSVSDKHTSAWRYDISDLVAFGISARELAATIPVTIAPQTWDATADPGTLSPEENTIVVRQVPPVHDELRRFFRDIRRQLSETAVERRIRETQQITKQYDVADFIDPQLPPEEFTKAVTEQVSRTTWERFGGRGKAELNGGALEVANAAWVHERLERLLELVRELGLERGRNGSSFKFTSALERARYSDYGDSDLDAALGQPISIEFMDTSLWDALHRIYELCGVFCHFPDAELGKAATKNTMRVTKTIRDLPLSSALNELLTQFKLDWYVTEYATVSVVTPEQAAARRDLRVFRIVELTEAGHSADQLVKTIAESIEPTSWQAAGGSATIRALPGVLLVRHNRRTHERIATFLESLAGK
jgi:hypothetical protein